MEVRTFNVELERKERFQFDVSFDDPAWPRVHVDEPAPLGDGTGPNASRLLGAAVANCLAASLLFCANKARVELAGLRAVVEGVVARNEAGRLRIGELRVKLVPTVVGEVSGRFDRCRDVFEDFCLVTESVRQGIDVLVEVTPEVVAAEPGDAQELAAR